MKNRVVCPARTMRNSPKPSRPMSGARRCSTPSSPSYIGRAMKSAGSSSTARSGVTMTHFNDPGAAVVSMLLQIADCRLQIEYSGDVANLQSQICNLQSWLAGLFLRLFHRLVDAADVHEGVFGQGVVFAVAQLFEAAD